MTKLEKREIQAQRTKARAEVRRPHTNAPARAVVIVPVKRADSSPPAGEGGSPRLDSGQRLSEFEGLAKAIGLRIVFSGLVPLSRPRPATLFGGGKVEELNAIVKAGESAVVVVDHPLTPVQQRNLELAWNAKVLDRTALILEIFADRAHSKEGRLQVELARLTWQKSRLVRSWSHLERQRGGFGFLGGPGETQIEADRRAIGERIDSIRADLARVEQTRRLHRRRRRAARQPVVSLVGYTNAGKSTLFNALSGAGVPAKDMLFATLDPALRRADFPAGGSVILSDTVGFISDLPTQLIAAFRATLGEVLEADLILHVRDMASSAAEAQGTAVKRVLAEIGIDEAHYAERVVEVWNKADLLASGERRALVKRAAHREPPAVLVSARAGQGLPELLALIRERLSRGGRHCEVVIGHHDGPLVNWLYENTEILGRHACDDGSLRFELRVPPGREPDLDRRLRRL